MIPRPQAEPAGLDRRPSAVIASRAPAKSGSPSSRARSPATIGAAKEVPRTAAKPDGPAGAAMSAPGAQKST
jgi:hypothetical protein